MDKAQRKVMLHICDYLDEVKAQRNDAENSTMAEYDLRILKAKDLKACAERFNTLLNCMVEHPDLVNRNLDSLRDLFAEAGHTFVREVTPEMGISKDDLAHRSRWNHLLAQCQVFTGTYNAQHEPSLKVTLEFIADIADTAFNMKKGSV